MGLFHNLRWEYYRNAVRNGKKKWWEIFEFGIYFGRRDVTGYPEGICVKYEEIWLIFWFEQYSFGLA